MGNSLKRGILSVLIANIINLGFSLLSNFLLPKYLSVDTYAQLKTFQLYASYAGLLHLGYVDGLYLKYGGENIRNINARDLELCLSTLRLFQLCITLLAIFIGFGLKNPILIAFGVSVLPANMMSCFKNLYQAIGEFEIYSRVINGTTISYFALNMIFIFVARSDNPYLYISIYIIVDIVLWCFLEFKLHRKLNIAIQVFTFSTTGFFDNIKTGVLLTLGNLSSTFLTGMDRWFIKILLDNIAFAEYSFAVSMEHFMNVAVTPISVTMYNYFCRETDENKIRKVRNSIQIFAAFLISSAFPAKFILEHFLQKYLESASVMFYLFGAQLFYIVIKSIYVNLYKANKQQRKYFEKIVIVIIIGAILNTACYCIYKGKEAFAVGTLISAIIWWILCINDNRKIKYSCREAVYLIFAEIAFVFCGNYLNSLVGLLAYILFVTFISWTLLNGDFCYLLSNGGNMVSSFIYRHKR